MAWGGVSLLYATFASLGLFATVFLTGNLQRQRTLTSSAHTISKGTANKLFYGAADAPQGELCMFACHK